MLNQPHQMPPDLDDRFLEFIDASLENQIELQRFYVPQFEGCARVVDLGCGRGGLVQLLAEAGHEAVGVDLDPAAVAAVRQLGLEGVQADALGYLRQRPDASIDGIFNGHLVEHLPVETVYALTHEAYRVLKPGGKLIVATPNPQAGIAHFELFYMHFDHKRFYHPNLLCFFMQQAGFERWEWGENPTQARLLFKDIWPLLDAANTDNPLDFSALAETLQHLGSTPEQPGTRRQRLREVVTAAVPPSHGWRRVFDPLRRALVNWLVTPALDARLHPMQQELDRQLDESKGYQDWLRIYADWLQMRLHQLDNSNSETRAALYRALGRLDRSFEGYALGVK